jgi:hypothetical protein
LTEAGAPSSGAGVMWVIEANIDAAGIAHDREGGFGFWTAGLGINRFTFWSTQPANAKITLTTTSHLIITNIVQGGIPNGMPTAHGDSNYTVLDTDGYVYTSAAFTAARTWTLPSPLSYIERTLTISDAFGGLSAANTLIISSSELIDGASTYVMRNPYESVTLQSVGSSWKIIAKVHAGEDQLISGYISGVASLDISLTPWALLGYKSYKLRMNNFVTNNEVNVIMRLSTDGGATFAATGYVTTYHYAQSDSAAGVWGGVGNYNTTGMVVGWWDPATTGSHFVAEATLHNPQLTTYPIMDVVGDNYSYNLIYLMLVDAVWPTSQDVDTIRIIPTSGNINGCFYSLSGQR